MHRTTYTVMRSWLGRWRDSRSITVITLSACNHNQVICSVFLVSNQIRMNARWVGQPYYSNVRWRRHVSVCVCVCVCVCVRACVRSCVRACVPVSKICKEKFGSCWWLSQSNPVVLASALTLCPWLSIPTNPLDHCFNSLVDSNGNNKDSAVMIISLWSFVEF